MVEPWVVVLGIVGLVTPLALTALVRRRAPASPLGRIESGVIAGAALLVIVLGAGASSWNIPTRAGLGIRGGFDVVPELLAALVAISVYSSAFIAELLRGAIQSVSPGQTEAGRALGVPKRVLMRRIILPQALRIAMPPLTNQYVNMVKQTAIVASIGFPDLMLVFGKTVLTQTGQAIEVLTLVAAVYLSISLLCAGAIHLYTRNLRSQGIG
jgi:general L-amino acid transport system permease protein